MTELNPKSWLDRLVGFCMSLLVAAVAVYVAVKLIQAVWVSLLVIVAVALLVGTSVVLLRRRRDSW